MNLFTRTFSKIFKSSNQQELDKIQNIIEAINNKENDSIYDRKINLFYGKKYINEVIDKLNFKIYPKSFFQTNNLLFRRIKPH